eukprot:gnl/MRDRNA2_/MRDRNA2_86718_c0_seq1.p1 gnl/MRDRNA2_/MRDRNA2_86718_c0~~gnl/MRDRNA2_/MRDRNA2_86718_c0_seq1.p1  ORF type:complete len:317 (+),score=3.81 gnl/MRDRNA2_/MRDRNA2_86718_c0_seq1:66-1016(+)
MVRGSRHSKNAGTMGSEAITYAENRACGYGTMVERLGKESFGNYYDCRLSLHPAQEPVCTPHGIIYSKEAILRCLVQQRKKIKRKMKVWLDLCNDAKCKRHEWLAIETESFSTKFKKSTCIVEDQKKILRIKRPILDSKNEMQSLNQDACIYDGLTSSNQRNLEHAGPNKTAKVLKPESYTKCPIMGTKLELKDLTALKFSTVSFASEKGLVSYFVDPITKDFFTNRSTLVCIRPTGDVVLLQTYKMVIESEKNYCDPKLKKKDIIELRKGGTGFAQSHGKSIVTSLRTSCEMKFRIAAPRGQHSGSGMRSGLVIL